MSTYKTVYFKKNQIYEKNKLEFYPVEMKKYFKPLEIKKSVGKGKNRKIEVVIDDNAFICIKDFVLDYSLRDLNNE